MSFFVALALAAGFVGARDWQPAQRALGEAYAKKDWPAMRAQARRLLELRDGAPADLYNLACAESLAGDAAAALARLGEMAAMGLSVPEAAGDADLAAARALPGWAALQARLAQNARPIAHSQLLQRLPAGLLPEDVASDPRTGELVISSVRQRKIVAVDRLGALRDLVPPQPGLFSILGLALDPERRALWATASALPHGDETPKAELGRSEFIRVDLDSGKIVARHEVALGKRHALGDATVGPNGDAYASDGFSGAVYRASADGKTFEALVEPGALGSPQTPAVVLGGAALVVPDYSRGLARLDLATREVRWLAHPRDAALTGIDGLNLVGGALIAVQNGTEPARILRLHPSADFTAIERVEVLESGVGPGKPTHGTVMGDRYVYVANPGWDRFDDDGKPLPAARPDEPALRWMALPR